MSILLAERLAALEANLNTKYGETLLQTRAIMEPVVQTESVNHYILNDIFPLVSPPMRRLLGSRNHRNIQLFDGAYNNVPKQCKEFESTVDIKRAELLADNRGVYADKIGPNLARQVVTHLDRQASFALLNSTTTHSQYVSYDGKAIFATDHTLDPSRSQSNLMTGSLTAENLQLALATAQGWTSNEGTSLNVGYEKPFLIVPPQLGFIAKSLVLPGLAADLKKPGETSNVLYDAAEVIVNPYLVSEASSWYLLFPLGGQAPITHASFIPPETVTRMDPEDPMVFERQVYSFGAFTMSHTYVPCWWQVLKSTGGGSSLYTGNNIIEL